jgi:hypothetical protein
MMITMKTRLHVCLALAALAGAVPATTRAQDSVALRPVVVGPPIQRIATASALSTEQLGVITSVRELADGRVLVNDGVRRRLLLMDTTLRTVEVVLDSLSEISNTYGTRPGALLPFRGDSILFVDPASLAIVVLDPAGKLARVRSVWRVAHVSYFSNSTGFMGWPGIDSKGRMVYRIPAQAAPPKVAPPPGVPYFPQDPDSAFVIAVDIDTRKVDTLGVVKIPKSNMTIRMMPSGGFMLDRSLNALPTTDDWAVLPDGRVAFVRWRDYRIDYLNPDGKWTSSEKLPFDWQRLTDADKERLIDSVTTMQRRSARSSFVSSMIRWVNQYGKDYPANFTVPEGFAVPPGFPKDWILPKGVTFPANYVYACPPGVEPPPMPAGPLPVPVSGAPGPVAAAPGGPRTPTCFPAPISITGGTVPLPPTLREPSVMPASELPDYRPPIATNGAVRADMEGNLWIRIVPSKPIPGGPVYDIVSPQGELVNRLQTPPGYTLVGFGKGKIVYLTMRDATGIHLARVRLK